jgi:hypothetical protein
VEGDLGFIDAKLRRVDRDKLDECLPDFGHEHDVAGVTDDVTCCVGGRPLCRAVRCDAVGCVVVRACGCVL